MYNIRRGVTTVDDVSKPVSRPNALGAFAQRLFVPVARATMTLVSVECTIAAWLMDRAVVHVPKLEGPVARVEDVLGLNRERDDDVVIDKYSHMGRPTNKGTLAAAMLLAAPLALPTLVLGQLSYVVFRMGLGRRFANPQGRPQAKAFMRAVKMNHQMCVHPGPFRSPKEMIRSIDPEYRLEQYVHPEGSDYEPTPDIQRRRMEWMSRQVPGLTSLRTASPEVQEAATEQIRLARQKIKHVVIIMQENHTFDDYFGKLVQDKGVVHQPSDPPAPITIDKHPVYPADDPPKYLFAWWPTHGNWSYRYQKFMAVHEYHDPTITPVTTYFAKNYAVLKHFHEFQRGPSHVNHLVQIAATAKGLLDNFHSGIVRWIRQDPVRPPLDVETVTHRLEFTGRTWGNYGNGVLTYGIKDLVNSPNNLPVGQFVADARNGKLRDVSYIVPPHFSLNEHSPDTVRDGQQWLNDIVQSVVEGGNWNDTAFLILYDDWGGYKQHNAPPTTMLWKDELPNAPDPNRKYGFGDEVAAMVVSPYAKKGYIFQDQKINEGEYRSFASVPAFLEAIFDIPPLTKHDATADNLLDAFDFKQTPNLPPPAYIGDAEIEVKGRSAEQSRNRQSLRASQERGAVLLGRKETSAPDRSLE